MKNQCLNCCMAKYYISYLDSFLKIRFWFIREKIFQFLINQEYKDLSVVGFSGRFLMSLIARLYFY